MAKINANLEKIRNECPEFEQSIEGKYSGYSIDEFKFIPHV